MGSLSLLDLSRREFLNKIVKTSAGVLVLPVAGSLGVAVISGCGKKKNSGDSSSSGSSGSDTTVYMVDAAGIGPHTHSFSIPNATLQMPPASGFTASTSSAAGHTHQITLMQTDLVGIAAAMSVAGNTTNNSGHSHSFTFP